MSEKWINSVGTSTSDIWEHEMMQMLQTLMPQFVHVGKITLNCTKFGKLHLRKIINIVATRCHIIKLKCSKLDFGWGSAPEPAGGAYSAPQDTLAGFKGAYFLEKGGEEGWEGKEMRG